MRELYIRIRSEETSTKLDALAARSKRTKNQTVELLLEKALAAVGEDTI